MLAELLGGPKELDRLQMDSNCFKKILFSILFFCWHFGPNEFDWIPANELSQSWRETNAVKRFELRNDQITSIGSNKELFFCLKFQIQIVIYGELTLFGKW